MAPICILVLTVSGSRSGQIRGDLVLIEFTGQLSFAVGTEDE